MRRTARADQELRDMNMLVSAIGSAKLMTVVRWWNEMFRVSEYGESSSFPAGRNDRRAWVNTDDGVNEVLRGKEPMEVYDLLTRGGYNRDDQYFYFNGYGYIGSFSELGSNRCPIDVERLAKWIMEQDRYDALRDFGLEADEL